MELSQDVRLTGDLSGREKMPEQEYDCPKHGKYTGNPIRLGSLDRVFNPVCPKCAEEERAQEQREKLEYQENLRRDRLKEMNIGERFWEESFETFNAYTPELQHHLQICMEFAGNPRGRKLVMLGNHGNGKNHLAASILKKTGGVIHKLMEMDLMIRETYNGDSREWVVISRLCNVEMLVIDEIGRTKPTPWELNTLSYIVDKRHENLRPMVLISNKHLKDDCPRRGGCPDCLENYVGNDILSRIIEDGVTMEFTGKDYRYKKRIENFGGRQDA